MAVVDNGVVAGKYKVQQNPNTSKWEVLEFKKATGKWFMVAAKESKAQADEHIKNLVAADANAPVKA